MVDEVLIGFGFWQVEVEGSGFSGIGKDTLEWRRDSRMPLGQVLWLRNQQVVAKAFELCLVHV